MVQQQAHYDDDTPNNFPDDYDESKVDSRVKLRSKAIRGKYRGADVRGALAQGIEIAGAIAGESVETAKTAETISQDTQNRFDDQIAGSTNDSEVIDARRKTGGDAYKTLKARLDDMPDNTDVGDLDAIDVSIDGGVQEPFTSALTSYEPTISQTTNVLRVGLLQDLHFMRAIYADEYGEATDRGLIHIQHMGKLAEQLDMVVYNGDTVHGREIKETTLNRIKQVVNTQAMAMPDTPVFYGVGNHDDNNVYFSGKDKVANTITLPELQIAFGEEETYTYKDFAGPNVRVIVLDAFENPEVYDTDGSIKYPRSYNSVFSQQQLVWLATKALKVPDGYHVIAFMHCPPLGFGFNKPYPQYQNVNHNLMLGIFRAFQSGTEFVATGTNADYPAAVSADFTAQGAGALACIVTGHEHHDLDPQTIDGITVVERTCNLANSGDGVDRTIGTVDEDAFDVIEMDTANRHVNFNRFGAGSSVAIDY